MRIKTIGRSLVLAICILIQLHAFASNQNVLTPPPGDGPVEIKVTLRVNKVFNINTVDENYQIDGYLVYSWYDERVKFTPIDSNSTSIYFENEHARAKLATEIWAPAFELINVQGNKETPNIMLDINSDGQVVYNERFRAVFSEDMLYYQFPFDTQTFKLEIESFSFDKYQLVFTDPIIYPEIKDSKNLFDKWKPISMNAYVMEKNYEHMKDVVPNHETFSRAVFELKAKRLSGFYIWQVLFPLIIIIMASFVIFWIEDFGTQIGLGFTLMLTVVAFNFYSASILPKLPYNTFIETVIMIGYLFIFLGILAVIVNYRVNVKREEEHKMDLMRYFRYLFPIVYFITMAVFYMKFYHF